MAHKNDTIYGEWAFSTPPIEPLSADHILGVRSLHDSSGRPDFVEISWMTSEPGRFQSVRMDYLNALALLSMLKGMQLDEGTPFPDDPRAPSHRKRNPPKPPS